MLQLDRDYDVVVVGARCSGAATARLLAIAGHRVLLVDRAGFPSDTLSTHGIARGGIVQLARWGLLDDVLATGARAVRQVTFRAMGSQRTTRIKDRYGVDMLVAPRRTVLDAVLVDAARDAGASVWTRTRLTALTRDRRGHIDGVVVEGRFGPPAALTARYVIGADGMRSTVARLVGAPVSRTFVAPNALFYAYVEELDDRGYEFAVGRQGFAGVFPTHDNASCVWVIRPEALMNRLRGAGSRRGAVFADEVGRVDPDLAARVRARRLASPVRGFRSPPNVVRQASGPGWSLVGDAGYYRDPITGHGITDAFRDAELLARALDEVLRERGGERERMSAFASGRDAAIDRIFRLTEALARFPEPIAFVDHQLELSEALEDEARMLSELPAVPGSVSPVAA